MVDKRRRKKRKRKSPSDFNVARENFYIIGGVMVVCVFVLLLFWLLLPQISDLYRQVFLF